MTQRSTQHATFVIERSFAASPSRVFQAWADPAAKARWFKGPDDWIAGEQFIDFRVGGRERLSGGPKGGQVHAFDCHYQDIVPNERIVYAYRMTLDGKPLSSSLASIEIRPEGEGTRLTLTEYGVYFDGFGEADAGGREHGTNWLMDRLGESLKD